MNTVYSLDRNPVIYRDNGGGGNRTRVQGQPEKDSLQEFRRRVVLLGDDMWYGQTTSLYGIEELEGPIKIGIAVDPHERIRTLQQGNPRPLLLLFACPATAFFEHFIHEYLFKSRLVGEWFKPDPPVLAVVEELISAAEICGDINGSGAGPANTDDVRSLIEDRFLATLAPVPRPENRERRFTWSEWLLAAAEGSL